MHAYATAARARLPNHTHITPHHITPCIWSAYALVPAPAAIGRCFMTTQASSGCHCLHMAAPCIDGHHAQHHTGTRKHTPRHTKDRTRKQRKPLSLSLCSAAALVDGGPHSITRLLHSRGCLSSYPPPSAAALLGLHPLRGKRKGAQQGGRKGGRGTGSEQRARAPQAFTRR